jgi:predicted membrane channel-forming protein YqfA (hemolysin III family)
MYSVTQTWRFSAWIPLIIAGVVLVLMVIQYHPPPRPATLEYEYGQLATRIDYLGGFLYIAGTALLLTGLIQGGFTLYASMLCICANETVAGIRFRLLPRQPSVVRS